jgi:cellulose synthase/poly-beta-1,6-N-acetylglucosamine synthase-like glycosyltransferase
MIIINIFFLCFFAINNINIKPPKISVIMPIYNIKKEYLIEAIESLINEKK